MILICTTVLQIFPDSKYYSGNVFSTSSNSLTPGIYVIQLNARSLNSIFREIDDYLSSLNYKFDIIAISETWVGEPEHNKLCDLEYATLIYASGSYLRDLLGYLFLLELRRDVNGTVSVSRLGL